VNPKVRDGLSVVQIDGESVIYDRVEDGLHHLNPSAGMVLQLCDGTGTAEEIAQDISAVGGLPLDQVLDQVQHMVHHFQGLGILEGGPPTENEDEPQAPANEAHDDHHHPVEQQHADEAPKDPDQLEEQDTQNH